MSIPLATAASSTGPVSAALASTRIGRESACPPIVASASAIVARTPRGRSASDTPLRLPAASAARRRAEIPRGSKT
jgi:hypothetical protein